MAIERFIETHKVFTTEEMQSECGSGSTTANLLSRAVARGKIERVKRGLCISHVGAAINREADKYEIGAKLFPGSVLAYQTALEDLGFDHYCAPRLFTCWGKENKSLTFHGVRYRCFAAPPELDSTISVKHFGFRVTSTEQTVVDCVDKPSRALGYENVCLSFSNAWPLVAPCLELARLRSPSCAKKVGLLLENSGREFSREELEAIACEKTRKLRGYAVFGRDASPHGKVFDPAWRVYVEPDVYELDGN